MSEKQEEAPVPAVTVQAGLASAAANAPVAEPVNDEEEEEQ
jgi:hypothetical protein